MCFQWKSYLFQVHTSSLAGILLFLGFTPAPDHAAEQQLLDSPLVGRSSCS
jgi:hypothetical protein